MAFSASSKPVCTLLTHAIGLYFTYYLRLSVVLPLMLAFDAWSVLPLWACMLLAACADFARALVLVVWFSDAHSDGGGAATVGWDGAMLSRDGHPIVGAVRIKRRTSACRRWRKPGLCRASSLVEGNVGQPGALLIDDDPPQQECEGVAHSPLECLPAVLVFGADIDGVIAIHIDFIMI